MGDPRTAALDPIFWLHHSNIDRLWEIWWKTRGSKNPTTPNWLSTLSFGFHDASGNVLTFTPLQVLDTTSLLHGYKYDDISDPILANPQLTAMAAMVAPGPSAQPDLVAASKPVVLNTAQATVEIPFRPQAALAARARIGSARPTRVFLNLENVTGRGALPKYDIYVDVPPAGLGASNRSPMPVGSLSLFGVDAASDPSGPQAGAGITSVIEITDQVNQLRREGRWDEARLHVTFMRRDVGARATAANELNVGRISVYYD
jgi:tyrosinase